MNITKDKLMYLLKMKERFPNKEDNPFKWNRWLGFIQGSMWAMKFITVNELKIQNKLGLYNALQKVFKTIRTEIGKIDN